MDAHEVEFGIFKLLNIAPDHGYALYNSLKEEYSIKSQSELYKIIRRLKQTGKISINQTVYEGKRPKEILALTDLGRREYYSILIESSRKFFDLIIETIVAKTQTIFMRIINENKMSFLLKNPNILYMDLEFPPLIQIQLITSMARYFEKPQKIYIGNRIGQNLALNPSKLMAPRKFNNVEIILLDENVQVKPGTIDILLIDAITFIKNYRKNLNHIELMNQNALALFIFPNRNNKNFGPRILMQFLDEFLESSNEKQNSLFLQSPIFQFFVQNRLAVKNTISNEEIINIIQEEFSEVFPIKHANEGDLPALEIIAARNPILKSSKRS